MKTKTEESTMSDAPSPSYPGSESDPLADLVDRFSKRLLAKLRLAQANGRSGWERDDWEKECQRGLLKHIAKGDPRDVAAYCAFMDHHGWITVPAPQPACDAQGAWQPMKIAPKNGTPIMMTGVTAGGSRWYMDGQVYAKGWIGGSAVNRTPNYWQPLPASFALPQDVEFPEREASSVPSTDGEALAGPNYIDEITGPGTVLHVPPMINPVQFERLIWIAKNRDPCNKPPAGLFGVTTWPQEMSDAAQAAIDEIERLVSVLEKETDS